MIAQMLIENLHQRGITLSAKNDILLVESPVGEITEEDKETLRKLKPELLALLSPVKPALPPLAHNEREQTIQEIEAAYHFLCEVERYANHWPEVEPVVRSWDNQTLEKNVKQYRRRIKEAGGIQTPETPPTS